MITFQKSSNIDKKEVTNKKTIAENFNMFLINLTTGNKKKHQAMQVLDHIFQI